MRLKSHIAPIRVKYKCKGKLVRSFRFAPGTLSIGANRTADLRLATSDVAGIIAVLEHRDGVGWVVSDLGSQPDLKIDGKSFVETVLGKNSVLQAGAHRLEFQVAQKSRTLFHEDEAGKGSRTLYVVKLRERVLLSTFDKAEVDAFKSVERDDLEVVSRKVSQSEKVLPERKFLDAEMRKPVMGTFGALLVFFLFLIGLPKIDTQEPEKPKENIYSKMIFDKKVLDGKRQKLLAKGMKMPTHVAGPAAKAGRADKAVQSLRSQGLQTLISKIAKNAGKGALKILAASQMASASASVAPKSGDWGRGDGATGAGAGSLSAMGKGKGFSVGGVGTKGKAGGGTGYRDGSGLGDGGIGKGDIGLDDAESVIEGGLDREVIAAVIREHLGQIRYCYERQLAATPELYGKVQVKFSIDAIGTVDTQSVGHTTMNNALVEECILRRIATWKFPKPRGGTRVLVSYPFLFKSVR